MKKAGKYSTPGESLLGPVSVAMGGHLMALNNVEMAKRAIDEAANVTNIPMSLKVAQTLIAEIDRLTAEVDRLQAQLHPPGEVITMKHENIKA